METDEKKIEAFIDKLMSVDTLEQPSLDFTTNVMSKVEAMSNSKATVYKPLISKPVWVLIFAGFLALVGYVIFNDATPSTNLLSSFDLSRFTNNTSIHFSKTLMYAVVLFAIMVIIQVPLLKHYFNKRMSF